MKKIAIIPARGGSKRIPRKNIKPFLGKPIIAYSIEAAIKSELFDEVMVSTDDDEIAEIAISFGAKIPFKRSSKNADDFATTVDVLLEVFEQYQALGLKFDLGCCIYPTAPFTKAAKLKEGLTLLSKGKFDSVLPVLPFSFPIQRAIRFKIGDGIEMFTSQHKMSRSQDLEPAFHDSGQFYWFNIKTLKEKKSIWTENTGAIKLSEMEAHDIDNIEDWKVAEFKFKLLNGHL